MVGDDRKKQHEASSFNDSISKAANNGEVFKEALKSDDCVAILCNCSSVKWSDPEHFLKSRGKFFLSFPCTLFYIFLTSKITDEILKSFLGRSILHYYQIRNI